MDGLYILTPDKHELYNSELDNDSHVKSLKRKFPLTSDAYLWHLRLGYINSKDSKTDQRWSLKAHGL